MAVKHKETRRESVDRTTGEVSVTTNIQTFKSSSEPAFVKLYIDDICALNGLSRACNNLLRSLIKRVGYDSVIMLHKMAKQDICKETGIKHIQTIDNRMGDLIKSGIVKRLCRGTFMLNPEYFAKGQWRDVAKLRKEYEIQMHVTYNRQEGRKIVANFDTGVMTDEDGESYIPTEDGEKIELT